MNSVHYEYEAEVRDGNQWIALPATDIVPSADLDRVPFAAATITAGGLSEQQWALLDPRLVDPHEGGQVRWRVRQLDPAGAVIGYLPRVGEATNQWATMYVRSVTRDLDVATIMLGGGETMVDDRLVIEDTGRLTSRYEISNVLAQPRTLGGYVDALLGLTFGAGHANPADDAAAAVLSRSAGPGTRLSNPEHVEIPIPAPAGASFMQLIETELSSLGMRLFDAWGLGWFVASRDKVAPSDPVNLRWASHDDDLPAGVEPIILSFNDTVSRDGDWADTVVVVGESPAFDSTRTWRHFAEGSARSRGRVIQITAGEPSGNLADSVVSRTFRRGRDIVVNTQIRMEATPGAPIELHLKSGVLAAEVVSVEWQTGRGEMTVHARSAQQISVDITDRQNATRVSAEKAMSEAEKLAAQAYEKSVQDTTAQIAENNRQKLWEFRRGWDGGF
ncbi:hypothetical protein HMPREF1529_02674 [Microbacterium sp. oral taxon 186 str. F0373]|uniref:hypothetical protein n=1 Tax=Microbacterium sp. oral taxon 186 TaxID=712383 RepID=UPI00034EBB50|nr:hypothetical protein [Microbacterium sp. oral taxon 186]EPD83298.1 hypothetical protein HMPREF1529_02674 [Microbacterium sp. oral taxon 186 str. F0373]